MTEDQFDLVMEYSIDIPTWDEQWDRGLNVDKAAAYLFGGSALAQWSDGKLQAGSVSYAKRVREQGGLKINGATHKAVRYVVTKEDEQRGFYTIGIGSQYQMPIGVPESVTIRKEDIQP